MSTKNLVLSTEDLEQLNQIVAHYQVYVSDRLVDARKKVLLAEHGYYVRNVDGARDSIPGLIQEQDTVKALLLKVVLAGAEVIE